jgi:hypothetical protein
LKNISDISVEVTGSRDKFSAGEIAPHRCGGTSNSTPSPLSAGGRSARRARTQVDASDSSPPSAAAIVENDVVVTVAAAHQPKNISYENWHL